MVDIDLRPAKLTDRFLAYLLDLLPFAAGYYASLYLLVIHSRFPNSWALWTRAALVWLVFYLFYQTLGNIQGGTLGKRLFGLRVVGLDGGSLGPGRGMARTFGYLCSMPLSLGFLSSLIHPQSRAWHDLIAGSMVVELGEKTPARTLATALVSVALLCSLVGGDLWLAFGRANTADESALRKAGQGLRILASMEEAYKASHGTYTDRLADLARASGDVQTFQRALSEFLDEDGFRLSASRQRYWLSGRAKDRARSRVALGGP